MRIALLLFMMLAGCSGVAYNTTVANSPAARLAMAQFVQPGVTTERQYTTRWGLPVQKVREGAQTEFIYRDMRDVIPVFPQFGSSTQYVIVTFQYGLATAVRTSDGIDCRATFTPRPPNYGFDNPTQVELVGSCPLQGLWGNDEAIAGVGTAAGARTGGITDDRYRPDSVSSVPTK
ncbi:MAG: hypothetical protein AAGA87_10290 [Pseudomonadota bacterium]